MNLNAGVLEPSSELRCVPNTGVSDDNVLDTLGNSDAKSECISIEHCAETPTSTESNMLEPNANVQLHTLHEMPTDISTPAHLTENLDSRDNVDFIKYSASQFPPLR